MRLLTILLLAVTLSSCGLFKKVSHTTNTDLEIKAETELSTDTSTKTKTDTDRQTITKTTETVDTQVRVPGTSVTVARPLTELIENGHIMAQDGTAVVRIEYDPTTGTVKATGKTEPTFMPIKIQRTEEVSEDLKTKETVKTDIETDLKEAVKADQETETKDVTTERNTSQIWMGTLIGIITMLLIIMGVAEVKRRFL
jgi:hypothetical protein